MAFIGFLVALIGAFVHLIEKRVGESESSHAS